MHKFHELVSGPPSLSIRQFGGSPHRAVAL